MPIHRPQDWKYGAPPHLPGAFDDLPVREPEPEPEAEEKPEPVLSAFEALNRALDAEKARESSRRRFSGRQRHYY